MRWRWWVRTMTWVRLGQGGEGGEDAAGAVVVGLEEDVVEEDGDRLGGRDVALDRGEAEGEEELLAGAVAELLDAAAGAVGGDRDQDVLVAVVDVGLQAREALAGQRGEQLVRAGQQRALVGAAVAGDRVAQDLLGEAGAGVALGDRADLGLERRGLLAQRGRLVGALQPGQLVLRAGDRARRPRRARRARGRSRDLELVGLDGGVVGVEVGDGRGDLVGRLAARAGEVAVERGDLLRAAPRRARRAARAGSARRRRLAPGGGAQRGELLVGLGDDGAGARPRRAPGRRSRWRARRARRPRRARRSRGGAAPGRRRARGGRRGRARAARRGSRRRPRTPRGAASSVASSAVSDAARSWSRAACSSVRRVASASSGARLSARPQPSRSVVHSEVQAVSAASARVARGLARPRARTAVRATASAARVARSASARRDSSRVSASSMSVASGTSAGGVAARNAASRARSGALRRGRAEAWRARRGGARRWRRGSAASVAVREVGEGRSRGGRGSVPAEAGDGRGVAGGRPGGGPGASVARSIAAAWRSRRRARSVGVAGELDEVALDVGEAGDVLGVAEALVGDVVGLGRRQLVLDRELLDVGDGLVGR